jgi:hypothetical protein
MHMARLGGGVSDLNAVHVLDLLLLPVCQILIADFHVVLSTPVKVDELDLAICIENWAFENHQRRIHERAVGSKPSLSADEHPAVV